MDSTVSNIYFPLYGCATAPVRAEVFLFSSAHLSVVPLAFAILSLPHRAAQFLHQSLAGFPCQSRAAVSSTLLEHPNHNPQTQQQPSWQRRYGPSTRQGVACQDRRTKIPASLMCSLVLTYAVAYWY